MKISKPAKSILQNTGLVILPFLTTLLCRSLKINVVNSNVIKGEIEKGNNFIIAFWHGTMMLPWYFFRDLNLTALISKSRDGSLLSNILEKWKYDVIRGSSNDGAKNAFDILNNLIASGKSLLITVDGPKGPAHKMKSGAVVLSQRNQVPLFLIGVAFKNRVKLKSWDTFEIPLPFSKVNLIFSNNLAFANNLTRDEIDKKISETEKLLNQLQFEAENL